MERITTATAEFSRLERRIYLCKIHNEAEIRLAESEENYKSMISLTQGEPYAVLIDARVTVNISKEAMQSSADPRKSLGLIAQAIVVNSLANRIIGNFVNKLRRPFAPTMLFSCQEEALEWLQNKVANWSVLVN